MVAPVSPYSKFYTRFYDAAAARPGKPETLHFASHSHHPWPDVTRDAQTEAWDDATRMLDRKWGGRILGGENGVEITSKRHIARHLDVNPSRLTFAPNTHEFVARLFSSFEGRPARRILTTDGEYHSAMWQFQRWKELSGVSVERVPVAPFGDFESRFAAAANQGPHEMIYLSQVFFNSGLAVDVEKIVKAIQDTDAMVVVDGYHAFMALPTTLAGIRDRVYYLGGGYKKAQAGEGACFMAVPEYCPWDPYDLGWFSTFSALGTGLNFDSPIKFGNSPEKYRGATYDPTALYRLNAVMALLEREGVTVADMDNYSKSLQTYFMTRLKDAKLSWLRPEQLITPSDLRRAGHFLSYRAADAGVRERQLDDRGVMVDSRMDFLRFGFGIYQDEPMIDRLFDVMGSI